ncbi:hypothetical protein B0I35DRAFT_456840 [Stachybotrys elegans]|uniref:Uncharacterized protein n=1 Tax=Stachybotrys elegans TaxID=80388 RepID=A0A8K0T963_9HYPO|nr:hypothetical protein B0I35DRAFT_456840 [Stachybotrys elegans]
MISFLSSILGRRARKGKVIETTKPLVQTIQAGLSSDGVYGMANPIRETAQNTSNLAGQGTRSIQLMSNSVANHTNILMAFSNIAGIATSAAIIVAVYQGYLLLRDIEGHLREISISQRATMALAAQKEFPMYVYTMIRERVEQNRDDPNSKHAFFMYHPDNDWHPGFYQLMKDNPIGREFSFRRYKRTKAKAKAIKLHLLIPAYQPLLIARALKIPEDIGDFVMEGRIHSGRALVTFNLPQEQSHYVQDIALYDPDDPQQGWANWIKSLVSGGPAERKVLGESIGGSRSREATGCYRFKTPASSKATLNLHS